MVEYAEIVMRTYTNNLELSKFIMKTDTNYDFQKNTMLDDAEE